MEIQFYPLDIDNVIIDGKDYIRIFGRTADSKRICVFEQFDYYFWVIPSKKNVEWVRRQIESIKVQDEKRVAYVKGTELHVKKFLGKEVKAIKVILNNSRDLSLISSEVKNVPGYGARKEIDFPLYKKYLIEKQITPLCLCKVDGSKLDTPLEVDICIRGKVLQESNDIIQDIRVLSFDIETSDPVLSAGNVDVPIVMLGLVGKDFKKCITWKKFETRENIEFVENETELLIRFRDTIKEYKPDYIVGYYSDGFDWPYIKSRADFLKVNLDFGLDKSKIRFNRRIHSTVKIIGIPHIDVCRFVKQVMSGDVASGSLQSYSLDSVAEEILGEKKLEVDILKLKEAWEKNEGLEKFCLYNIKDVELCLKIFERILPNINELVKIVSQPIYDVSKMTFGQLIENYLMKKTREFNEVIPGRPTFGERENRTYKTYTGGFVYEPKPGLYENLAVFDFRGMHPSIISAHNICLSTITDNVSEAKETPELDGEKYYFNYKEEGFIPKIIKELIERRIRIKEMIKKKDDPVLKARSYALKIIAAGFHGYMGYAGARWYSVDCAAGILAYVRYYIKKLIFQAQKSGFNVIYGDSLIKERFVTLLNPKGIIEIKKVEDLFDVTNNKYNLLEKEYSIPKGYKVLTINPKNKNIEFKDIKKVIRHKTNKQIYRFNQKYGETIITEDHSIISKDLKEHTPQEMKKLNLSVAFTRKCPDVKQITEIDLLDYTKNYNYSKVYKGKKKISKFEKNNKYIWFGWTNRKIPIKIKRFIKVESKDFLALCKLIGSYIPEGSSSTPETTLSRCGASISGGNIEKLEELKEAYLKLFINSKSSIIPSQKGERTLKYGTKVIKYQDNTHKLQMMNNLSAVFFKNLCGQKSIGKRLPNFVFHIPNKYKMLILNELIEGDGSRIFDKRNSKNYVNKNFNYTTKSLGLISDISLLLNQLEINYTIQYRKSKQVYTIKTCTRYNKRLKTKITKENYNDYVYDLEVEGNHNFVDACGHIFLHNTDSVFVEMKDKNKDDALKFVEEFSNELPSLMELEVESFYERGIFVGKKSGTKGAKKKYALISDGKIKVRGFESVRRDWSFISRDIQKKVLKFILEEKDLKKALDYVKEKINDVKEKKIKKEDLIISTQLKKNIDEYEAIGPHVAVARRMLNKNIKVQTGAIIQYIITEGEGLIRDKARLVEEAKNYDAEYYINHQIIPSVESIFEAVGYGKEDLLSKGNQVKLGEF